MYADIIFAILYPSTFQRAILHLLDAARSRPRTHDANLSLDGLPLRHQRHHQSDHRNRRPRLPEGSFQSPIMLMMVVVVVVFVCRRRRRRRTLYDKRRDKEF